MKIAECSQMPLIKPVSIAYLKNELIIILGQSAFATIPFHFSLMKRWVVQKMYFYIFTNCSDGIIGHTIPRSVDVADFSPHKFPEITQKFNIIICV